MRKFEIIDGYNETEIIKNVIFSDEVSDGTMLDISTTMFSGEEIPYWCLSPELSNDGEIDCHEMIEFDRDDDGMHYWISFYNNSIKIKQYSGKLVFELPGNVKKAHITFGPGTEPDIGVDAEPKFGKKLKMWTTGNKLCCGTIDNAFVEAGTKIYFFSRSYQIPLVKETYDENGYVMVDIPDIFLTKEENIKVQIDEDDYYQTFEVVRQNKPSDYDADLESAVPSGGGSGGVTSYNDLTDTPCGVKMGKVDIIPEQEVVVTDNQIQCVNVKDACYDLGVCDDPGVISAVLEINGEIIESEIRYYYANAGTFGNYTLQHDRLELQEGASVQNGDTVTVRLYVEAEIVSPLDEKYLPSNVAKINYAQPDSFVVVSEVDTNGKPTRYTDYSFDYVKNSVKSAVVEELPQQVTKTFKKENCVENQTSNTFNINAFTAYDKFILQLTGYYIVENTAQQLHATDYYIYVQAGPVKGLFKNMGLSNGVFDSGHNLIYIIGNRIAPDLYELSVSYEYGVKGTEPTIKCITVTEAECLEGFTMNICNEEGEIDDTLKYGSTISAKLYTYS